MANTVETAKRTTWKIDPSHTTAEFSVKHMMITTVKGHFGKVAGTVKLDHNDFTTAEIEATIDVATINTRDEKRDAHLRSADFFGTDKYPQITFRSTSVKKTGDDEYKLIGDLTMHGITRPIELEATHEGQGTNPYGLEVISFNAKATLNRKDYDLNWNVGLEAGGVLVSDNVKIELDVQAIKEGE